jgi:hypothetical protein
VDSLSSAYTDRFEEFSRNISNSVDIYRKHEFSATQSALHHKHHAEVARASGDVKNADLYDELVEALKDAADAFRDAKEFAQSIHDNYTRQETKTG